MLFAAVAVDAVVSCAVSGVSWPGVLLLQMLLLYIGASAMYATMRVLYACAGATYACAVHYVLLMCAGVEGSAAVYAESACC